MKTSTLSTVYLDRQRVGLMGDPKPMVAKVVIAGGRLPAEVQVERSQSPDVAGTPVDLEEIIDRTADPAKPIYLTCRARGPDDQKGEPVYTWPMPGTAVPKLRGPLPALPSPPPRTGPAPGGPDGAGPEWGAPLD